MKQILIFSLTIAAASILAHYPSPSLYIRAPVGPPQLQGRIVRRKGKGAVIQGVGQPETAEKIISKGSTEFNTRVQARLTGSGTIGTDTYQGQAVSHIVNEGQRTKEAQDPVFSKAEAKSDGRPPHGALQQSRHLHPAKVEGWGQSGKVKVAAPSGGYGYMQKEVHGNVVETKRVQPGTEEFIEHIGEGPNEVKLSGSASKGGSAFVQANNIVKWEHPRIE